MPVRDEQGSGLAINAIALVSPGPDFTVVTRIAIVSGRSAGQWAAAGIASAIGLYVLVGESFPWFALIALSAARRETRIV
ncbi:hypothetical protein [Niveibacterium terrae]|uniref:hypothetical protein n=1 Tax=Niveibacterium terrae TaxID=3373598 RepID=UPI003A907C07